MFMRGEILLILAVIFIVGCQVNETYKIVDLPLLEEQEEVDNMKLTSSAFEHNGDIPEEFTCDDADISPPLAIEEASENAKSLALIMDDPDAPVGTFVHWVVWNIDPTTTEIKKGEQIPWPQGRTDFGKQGYGGPCPPGGTHRYFFKLYALDTKLDLQPRSTKRDLERAMEGHIIEKAELMGKYSR